MLDPATHQPATSIRLPNRIGSSIHGYGRWEDRRTSGFWASKQVDDDYDDDSGVFPPPLWNTMSPTRRAEFDKNYYQSLSPSSRTQAIARGQRELMEMVRNMPESTYELTLKDLVEKTKAEVGEENEKEEENLINKKACRREGSGSSSSRKVDHRAVAMRRGNVQSGGFYLKMMMFPPSLGSTKKKKKNSDSSGNEGSKATLRSSVSEGSLKGIVGKEWWKKSTSASGDSESGATSINSGSTKSSGSSGGGSSRSSSRGERSVGGCWFLIGKPKRLLTRE